MTVNNHIVAALKEFERPVFPDKYDKNIEYEPEVAFIQNVGLGYFVFNYISETGVLYGDNKELEDKTTLYIHYYTYDILDNIVEPIKQALTRYGFIITFVRRTHENDTGYNHLTAEVSICSCDMEV